MLYTHNRASPTSSNLVSVWRAAARHDISLATQRLHQTRKLHVQDDHDPIEEVGEDYLQQSRKNPILSQAHHLSFPTARACAPSLNTRGYIVPARPQKKDRAMMLPVDVPSPCYNAKTQEEKQTPLSMYSSRHHTTFHASCTQFTPTLPLPLNAPPPTSSLSLTAD